MKEWKGLVEKEFTLVHYADMKVNTDKRRQYFFTLNSDGKSSAKTPPMFLENDLQNESENDAWLFLSKVREVLSQNNEQQQINKGV